VTATVTPILNFAIEAAAALPFAAVPTIAFRLSVQCPDASQRIQSVALRCQIQIEAQRRTYKAEERAGLRDLFGEPDRWSQTLRPLLWSHASITVPEFEGAVKVELPVACTFDFNVAAAKYFHAVEEGDIPLVFQFSGTVFYAAQDAAMQIGQIGWDRESQFRLSARVWQEMMDLYYPNSAWLRLRRDVFDRLHAFKQQQGLATWEEALEHLLAPVAKRAAS
jgi:Family of unknown function (DUF6084)